MSLSHTRANCGARPIVHSLIKRLSAGFPRNIVCADANSTTWRDSRASHRATLETSGILNCSVLAISPSRSPRLLCFHSDYRGPRASGAFKGLGTGRTRCAPPLVSGASNLEPFPQDVGSRQSLIVYRRSPVAFLHLLPSTGANCSDSLGQ